MKLHEQNEIDELEPLLKMGTLTVKTLYRKLVEAGSDEETVRNLFKICVETGALAYHIEKLKEDNREIAESN